MVRKMTSLTTLYKTSFPNVVFVPYYGNKLRSLFFIISQTSVLLKKITNKAFTDFTHEIADVWPCRIKEFTEN